MISPGCLVIDSQGKAFKIKSVESKYVVCTEMNGKDNFKFGKKELSLLDSYQVYSVPRVGGPKPKKTDGRKKTNPKNPS